MKKFLNQWLNKQDGVTGIVVALLMFLFLGFSALTIDVGHLYVVHNELQNAADAAALAGARFLYNDDGTAVNVEANQTAYDTAIANKSEGIDVEVNWSGGNSGDVQRGHWSFATRTFTPNGSTASIDLWNVSSEELDLNTNFINAIRTRTRREGTPVTSYFARILGHESFQRSAEAIAYIGFAGTLTPYDVEQPIAICRESILIGDSYSCNIGRMINSGQNVGSSETGGWTNFSQDGACTGGTNALEVRNAVCGSGNPDSLSLAESMATNGGDIQSAFNELIQCWANKTGKVAPWNVTLPVVSCPGNNMGTCEELHGAVNLNILWITDGGEDPGFKNAPTQMAGTPPSYADWFYPADSDNTNGAQRWASFVTRFNLQNVDETPAPYNKKSIYFLPDCTPHDPIGVSGGENFGILAKIPVLVK
jgi:Flp pilus assembly protein TadG